MASTVPTFSKRDAYAAILGLVEKVGEQQDLAMWYLVSTYPLPAWTSPVGSVGAHLQYMRLFVVRSFTAIDESALSFLRRGPPVKQWVCTSSAQIHLLE
eukprot:scaffold63857_cov39-Tisochrysis_lutea.AAC.3